MAGGDKKLRRQSLEPEFDVFGLALIPRDRLVELRFRFGKGGRQLLKGCIRMRSPERGQGIESGDALDTLLEDAPRGTYGFLNPDAVIGFACIEATRDVGSEDA